MTKGRPGKVQWTKDQDEKIREMYPKLGGTKLAASMKVPYRCLVNRASYLGIKLDRKFHWTADALQVLRDRYEQDGPQLLAKEWGTTAFAVTARARRLGIGATRKKPPRDFEWTDNLLDVLQQRYVDEGGHVLAKELGLNVDTVRRKASELDLHTIAGHKRWGRERASKNDSCDIHFFDQWSENMAYVLGFLFADGSINKECTGLRVCMSRKDDVIVRYIKALLGLKRKIRHDKEGESTLIVNSTLLVKRLMELGMMPRKTYRDDPFPDVPDEWMPHFVRGNLDGDGTTSISGKDVISVGFTGTSQFVVTLHDRLTVLAGMRKKTVQFLQSETAKWATISWSAVEDVKAFYKFAYPEGFEFCLERKQQNLIDWLSKERFGRGHYHRGKRKDKS